jgi:hypothetical protein
VHALLCPRRKENRTNPSREKGKLVRAEIRHPMLILAAKPQQIPSLMLKRNTPFPYFQMPSLLQSPLLL